MRKFISKQELAKIRTLDAFTYFQNYRPDDIKKFSRNDWILKEHDSLHFSNGKWYWWSRQTGGTSALDFLQVVEGYSFIDACNYLLDLKRIEEPIKYQNTKSTQPIFKLPEPDVNNNLAFNYLTKTRCIDKDIVNYFIGKKMIYQDKQFRNVVFVGYDGNKPKYAFKRSIFQDFKGDAYGSDKTFSFSFSNPYSKELHIFEAAIDMLSYMTLVKMDHKPPLDFNYLSLAGASNQISNKTECDLPLALKGFLERNKQVKTIVFHLDNDVVGIGATKKMMDVLCKNYEVKDEHPTTTKDVNELLVAITKQRKEKLHEPSR